MRARRAVVALLAILAAPGCRAVGPTLARPDPVAPVASPAIAELIAAHNRNAERVQSLEAEPSVAKSRLASGNGRIALVRPRNFKMTVAKPASGDIIAEFGSNAEEFWIWSADAPERAVYVGHYDATGQPPPGLSVQPEWVIEALGLQIIEPEEESRIVAEPGTDPATLTLVHTRPNGQGGTTIKKTVVDRTQGLIREHIFYAPDGKTPMARALPSEYTAVRLPEGGSVVLPNRLRIVATPPEQEPMELRVVLGTSSVRINQFSEANRDIFTVPRFEGYALVNINETLIPPEGAERAGTRFDYETLPTPPAGQGAGADRTSGSGSGVQLGEPIPLGPDGQARRPTDPTPRLSDDLREPGGIDAVIGARLPRPPGAVETGSDRVPRMSGVGFGTQTVR